MRIEKSTESHPLKIQLRDRMPDRREFVILNANATTAPLSPSTFREDLGKLTILIKGREFQAQRSRDEL